MIAADGNVPERDDSVGLFELSTYKLIGFRNRDGVFHSGQEQKRGRINWSSVLKNAYGGTLTALYYPGNITLLFDGNHNLCDFFFGGIAAHNHQHMNLLSIGNQTELENERRVTPNEVSSLAGEHPSNTQHQVVSIRFACEKAIPTGPVWSMSFSGKFCLFSKR
jgi:hypothetical protein